MSGPLAGIRVIDVAIAVLGPVAAQVLGDMGAEVIKVETPDGDPMRQIGPARNPGMAAYFLNVNRNKKSLVLDLKRPAARAAMLRLAATADVFLHNMRPGAATRLGIDYQAIAAANPRIVYAWASGFRPDTPYRDRAAFDDVIQGESGLAALNGGADGEPRYVPMVVCDKVSGHVLAGAVAMALLRARAHRQGPGGARADDGDDGRLQPRRPSLARRVRRAGKGPRLPAHADPLPAALCDGGRACLPAGDDRPAVAQPVRRDRPARLADDPRFATIAGRTANIDELYTLLAERMRLRTTAEWRERLDRFDVPNGGRQRPRRPRRRPLSERNRLFPAGRASDRRTDRDDGDPGQLFRNARRICGCRRRGSASTIPRSSANSASTRPRSPRSRPRRR